MHSTAGTALLATLLVLIVAGCAARRAQPGGAETDPLEPVNRGVFWVNDRLDAYALAPVATGWDRVAPDPVQRAVARFFTHVRFPIVFVNDVLQGKVQAAAQDVARFTVNTTAGALGFLDPASRWGLPQHAEDFGQTLGWWGVPPGPYLVLPVLGPSSPRDTVGLVGDAAASIAPFFVDGWILLGARTVDVVNARSLVLDEVEEAKRAAIDYYVFVRNAYVQRRRTLIDDTTATRGGDDASLYFPELGTEE